MALAPQRSFLAASFKHAVKETTLAACSSRPRLASASPSLLNSSRCFSKGSDRLAGGASANRSFQTSARVQHGGIERPEPGKGIKVIFRDSKGVDIKTVEANEGDDLLSIAHEYDIDLEGACEGSIACSTCHVILDSRIYDKMEEPGDDENDMLDLAFGLTDTSRLGCQIKLTRELDGMVAQLPSATRNMYVDGAKGGHGN
ncbi:hypothetical protein CBS101457_001151 [Exobasidium rhododendri]|nr:hypothetical protein CBS101457_001151 [Exobasidium rhododendri]